MDSLTSRFYKEVFLPYLDLLKSGYRFHPAFAHARRMWEEKLTANELVSGPYLEKSQIYQEGCGLDELPLHDKTKGTIRKRLGGRGLWKHQTDALQLILAGTNAVIATGTSSGKTLCYQIPILDDLVRDPAAGLRAVIIYPLNALVNDQLTEWEQMLAEHRHITFARFTGQTPNSQSDYLATLRDTFREELAGQGFTQHELQQKVEQRVAERLRIDLPNRLNHRDDIRSNPPQVLITNFSMLEYLLERPVDAPIFTNSRLKFLVLDEAHAYRGVQATEIAFLVRRIKDRLSLKRLVCIATSATLGRRDNPDSKAKVRRFATDLFGEPFIDPNPIYGEAAQPVLLEPAFCPTPDQYMKAVERLRNDPSSDMRNTLGMDVPEKDLASLLLHDGNLHRLRKETIEKATLLTMAAEALWPEHPSAVQGLEALLEIVAAAKVDQTHEDLLPTRLHYFVRAQDGLHVCFHKQCPGRQGGKPAFFVSRKSDPDVPEGECPDCYRIGRKSKLVEIVTCRKCGYLYGALQDLGPRRAQSADTDGEQKPYFDSFSTELGWVGDSYWSYFSVNDDIPYPEHVTADEDDDPNDLIAKPVELHWCVLCGKKKDQGAGETCTCEEPHLRVIKIFHRQCPHTGKAKDHENLYRPQKSLLATCPNCGARNGSGIEPLHRFQESDDEMGLAMAVPLAHFQVSPKKEAKDPPRKLLCFTDHRQRAAAFPSLLEEETFSHDTGRKIIEILDREQKALDIPTLGEYLADEEERDTQFFLPVSRLPDEEPDAKARRKLWLAETFAYFGVPDSARESAEDLGLVTVEYRLKDNERADFRKEFANTKLGDAEADGVLQVLLGFMRQRKAFTLPKGVQPDVPAFGRVTADIAYVLRREGVRNNNGWLPRVNKDNTVVSDNIITDYLRRVLSLPTDDALEIAKNLWTFLTSRSLLIENRGRWKLDHQRLFVFRATSRYVCDRCGIVTSYSVKNCCIRKSCEGRLESRTFMPANVIEKWVSGHGSPKFFTLKSEEHTAQINKDLAKVIEDEFRAGGINLLSSTTTFEMGINIGDLQKVLLRNAPPSSASYVQRVGRAGRGRDKNSVCVTLCRRTKYDADAWREPPRLMSGEVRTPTVFIANRVIAQRHFNAVVFARYLRIKIADERVLGAVKQQIRLESFLPPDVRAGIPDAWFQVRPSNLYLDFHHWLGQRTDAELFQSPAARSLVEAIGGFDAGIAAAASKYKLVSASICDELSALTAERERLHKLGGQVSDVEHAIKNLLGSDIISVLAKRGFLPRYAFPLDVVTLETGTTRWSRDADVELSRDRGIAIAEFAPGSQVIAHKKVFTSAGLYVVSKMDRPERRWYSECPSCKQIRTEPTREKLMGPCAVCQKSITSQHIRPFVEPVAFSVRVDEQSGAERYRRSTLIRQRQSLTHFIDHLEEPRFQDRGQFHLALKDDGALFRYNPGPENKGFMLCPECGCSEPLRGYKAGKRHHRLRPIGGNIECSKDSPWTQGLAYGHQFKSYCLIARPITPPESVESLAYSLQKGLCIALDLESSDIGVSWRRVGKNKDMIGSEIVLYDQTPGGAGFVRDAFDNWEQVTRAAKKVCEQCTCERACYDCLKSYANQSQHEKLFRLAVLGFFNETLES